MTITINIINNVIPQFPIGSSLCITKYLFNPKTTYERGDAYYYIQLTTKSTVQSTPLVCHHIRLTQNNTTHALIRSNN